MYVLYNNKYYLMQNAIKQFVPTPELNESFQFSDKTKADNALANLPKQMRNLGYFVQQIDTPTKPVDFDQFTNVDLVDCAALATIGGTQCLWHGALSRIGIYRSALYDSYQYGHY